MRAPESSGRSSSARDDPLVGAARELVERSTVSSGVPVCVEDETALTRVAEVMRIALDDETCGRTP